MSTESKLKPPRRIVIVGGGTAGWMAANLMAHAWSWSQTSITLIESSDVPTVGVGEGSTPYLRTFFDKLGIAESQWMPRCHATYKCGIRFDDWSTKPGAQSYFHPFFSQLDLDPAEGFFHNCTLRRQGYNVYAHPDKFFVCAELARKNKAPKRVNSPDLDFDYAYHFDAGLLGEFLKEEAVKRGVYHTVDHIDSVELNPDQSIRSLKTKKSGAWAADLFVDCSGFASLLMGKALKEPFTSYSDCLFNDRAVAIPTPASSSKGGMPSSTRSVALSNGWAWEIPLTHRVGNGYVYCSQFLSEEQAEDELRRHLGKEAEGQDARHLKMRVGRLNKHWKANCLSVGLSQGFIEPLEATALMLIQISIDAFIQEYSTGGACEGSKDRFNNRINRLFDGVKDYISMHYRLNSRSDTPYWKACRHDIALSDSVREIEDAWSGGADFDRALNQHSHTQIYLRPSWYCILAGMGHYPQATKNAAALKKTSASKSLKICQKTASAFYDHQHYLSKAS